MKQFSDLLHEKLAECRVCTLANTKGGIYTNSTGAPIDIIFIAQNPGASWYDKFVKPEDIVPFSIDKKTPYNRYFDYLFGLFEEKYERPISFYITNLVKCATKDNDLKDLSMIKECSERFLAKELKYLLSKNENVKIISLGKHCKEYLSLPETKGIVYSYHPGYLNRKGTQYLQNYVKEIFDESFL